jgi:hypothetical protein
MNSKVLITRTLIKEILDELISTRNECGDLGFGKAVDRLNSMITRLITELTEDNKQ